MTESTELLESPGGAPELFAALVEAQGHFPNVARNVSGVVGADKTDIDERTGKGRGVEKKYADLAEVVATVRPILAAHGLGYIQAPTTPSEGYVSTTTRLIHKSGQWIESTITMTAGRTPQQQGIVITYSRRYAIVAMLGLATEEDPDGNGVEDNQAPSRARARAPRVARQRTPSGREPTTAVPPPDHDFWHRNGWDHKEAHDARLEEIRAVVRKLPKEAREDAKTWLHDRAGASHPPYALDVMTEYGRKVAELVASAPPPGPDPDPADTPSEPADGAYADEFSDAPFD